MKSKVLFAVKFLAVLIVFSLGINIYLAANMYRQNLKSVSYQTRETSEDISMEEYVWVTPFREHPMFKNHDEKALKRFAEDVGVKVTIEGPSGFDVPAQIAAFEKVIKRKPAGIMVLASDPSIAPLINKAVEAGISTITVDADIKESKRLAYVGSNWFNIGVKQAEAMVRLIGGKGKVAMLGMVGAENMEQGFEGFKSVMSAYSDVVVLSKYDDMGSVEKAKKITEELLGTHPDIAGIAGFDGNSGPGIGAAIKEAGLEGKVVVTAVDIESEHLRLVKEGVIQKLVGQKRELFTYYGMRLLYDMNHSTITLTHDDRKNGITPIPYIIDTGLIEVDQTNVDRISGSLD